jgi:hypothetical protein
LRTMDMAVLYDAEREKKPLLKKLYFTAIFLAAGMGSTIKAQETDVLKPYTSCHFSDGLQIVKIDPLAAGVTSRPVETADGVRHIDMIAGLRIMLAYPLSDFYANIKVESLPADHYAELKRWLIENYDYILSTSKDSRANTSLHSPVEGFDIRGNDRDKLAGGVLGLYLAFDDKAHVVTTMYLLNQEPYERKFQNIEEYGKLRDSFVPAYLACVRTNQQLQSWAEKK